jgi:hypothetical protein
VAICGKEDLMELNLPVFRVEVALPNFLIRGKFQPRGDILVFLNDPSNSYFRFDEVELLTLSPDYHIPGIKQPAMSINRQMMSFLAILDSEHTGQMQVLQTKRPTVFYYEWCAVQGDLHVNPDARDDDLLGESRDFLAVSNASVYPTKTLTNAPSNRAPFILINRHLISVYHVRVSKGT